MSETGMQIDPVKTLEISTDDYENADDALRVLYDAQTSLRESSAHLSAANNMLEAADAVRREALTAAAKEATHRLHNADVDPTPSNVTDAVVAALQTGGDAAEWRDEADLYAEQAEAHFDEADALADAAAESLVEYERLVEADDSETDVAANAGEGASAPSDGTLATHCERLANGDFEPSGDLDGSDVVIPPNGPKASERGRERLRDAGMILRDRDDDGDLDTNERDESDEDDGEGE